MMGFYAFSQGQTTSTYEFPKKKGQAMGHPVVVRFLSQVVSEKMGFQGLEWAPWAKRKIGLPTWNWTTKAMSPCRVRKSAGKTIHESDFPVIAPVEGKVV